jgi:hypothetical protein
MSLLVVSDARFRRHFWTLTGPYLIKQEVVLAEAMVIDVYLAEEFGLLGDTKYEELTIKAFNSSVHFLMDRFFRSLFSPAERKQT